MNEKLVLSYLRKILRMFTFQKRLLAWDTCEAHMKEAVKKLLKEMKTDDALIPGGCTKYIQGPDVSWNKPFKEYIMEFYDEWLATGIMVVIIIITYYHFHNYHYHYYLCLSNEYFE